MKWWNRNMQYRREVETSMKYDDYLHLEGANTNNYDNTDIWKDTFSLPASWRCGWNIARCYPVGNRAFELPGAARIIVRIVIILLLITIIVIITSFSSPSNPEIVSKVVQISSHHHHCQCVHQILVIILGRCGKKLTRPVRRMFCQKNNQHLYHQIALPRTASISSPSSYETRRWLDHVYCMCLHKKESGPAWTTEL